MTRWPTQLPLLLLVAAAAAAVAVLLRPAAAACIGAGPATNGSDTVELYPEIVPPNLTPLVIGYLTAIKGDLKDRQGLAISGALTMALDEINRDREFLPDVFLQMRWNDARGDTVMATRAITDMICDGVVAFFGPEGPCYVEAIVSQSRNIPMISYRCSDYKASSIPTFARTEPPDTQVTRSVISMLLYYGWRRFSIIYEESWTTVASSLKEQALLKNMTINHSEQMIDNHKCCENSWTCCRSGYWFQLIQNTMNRTRIYVFLGSSSALVDMMSSMDSSQLFDKGEYMVIFVDMMTYSARTSAEYLFKTDQVTRMASCSDEMDRIKLRARSLLVVVSSEPSNNYDTFMNMVGNYTQRPPFNFVKPPLFLQYKKHVSISAAYLYDSVRLYAWALDKQLRAQNVSQMTEEVIREVAANGTAIIETIIQLNKYQSISGATIKIDRHGDSEGNFSVLAFKNAPPVNITHNISCSQYLVPVASFLQGDNDMPEYKIHSPQMRIDWPGPEKPADQPICGFHDELCSKNESHVTSLVVACTLGLSLFCVSVVAVSIYRKWKIELEIEGLLWRIEPDEIKGYNFNLNNDIVASPSKLSLISAASFGSRCSNQVFTTTGRYRGMVVRMKELKYARKKDISRDIMKEMRLLRDLRHDNINSFIGAVVEPMRSLLVTDYCAKGSLYDIVENEDIKLDEMFVASLVHDLIKGMIYIHDSALVFHGNLKSSNCVVTSRWMLQVSDFGLHDLRHCAESESIGEHQYYRNQFWKAPELLRDASNFGSQKADVYAFAIILYEMIGRKGPFGHIRLEPKEIVESVRTQPAEEALAFRPDMECILDSSICAEYIVDCIRDSWHETPELRPDFPTIRQRLKRMRGGKSRNIMDQIMELMEKYANNLEDVVNERTRQLCDEKRKTEDLLHRMLPESVAESLTRGLGVEPVSYNSVTIYFSDIVGFTALSAVSTPLQVVNFLNDLYTLFDRVIKGYDVYKVETIGDAYMVVSGLPINNGERHVGEIASMSLDLLYAIRHHRIAHRPQEVLKLRVGMHTGPVVAGVVGLTMPRYCLFGDTVNTASRMESNGEALRIHISVQCKEALDRLGGYVTEDRGRIQMKGKGEVQTYWLVGATETAVQRREVNMGDLQPLFVRPRYSPRQMMAADSRQGSIMELQNFGSRRQSAIPRGGEAISMYSLQGAIITAQPQIAQLRESPRSSSQRRIDRTPLLLSGPEHTLAIDDGAAAAAAADDDPDQQRPLLDDRPQYRPEIIRQPLLTRPSTSASMDPFPSAASAAVRPTVAGRLRRRVDSVISLVSPSARRPTSTSAYQRRHSSRSLDAGVTVDATTSDVASVALIEVAEVAAAVRTYNGDGDGGGGDGGVTTASNGVGGATDLGTQIVPYKPYLNNNCNGGNGSSGSSSTATAAAAAAAEAAAAMNSGRANPTHADSPHCPLLYRQSSLTDAASVTVTVPAATAATKAHVLSSDGGASHSITTFREDQQLHDHTKRWRSLDPMGGGGGGFSGSGGDYDEREGGDPLDADGGSGGKKPMQRGSIRMWFAGLFQGRGVQPRLMAGGGGAGGVATVIVSAAAASRNHVGGGGGGGGGSVAFGEISGAATPESESIV